MNEFKHIEDMLRRDAARMQPETLMPDDTRRAVRFAAARACLAAERRRRQRRQIIIMLAAALPVAVLLGVAAYGYISGNRVPLRLLAWPAGILSACALLVLPILENFITLKQNGGTSHAS